MVTLTNNVLLIVIIIIGVVGLNIIAYYAVTVMPPDDTITTATNATMLPQSTPTIVPQNKYVECTDYYKVTEKWKTPTKFVIVTNETGIVNIEEKDYDNTTAGEYVHKDSGRAFYYHGDVIDRDGSVKLKPVTESESGYRNACEVIS